MLLLHRKLLKLFPSQLCSSIVHHLPSIFSPECLWLNTSPAACLALAGLQGSAPIVPAALLGFVPSDHLTEPHCEGLTGGRPTCSGCFLPWMTQMQMLLSLLATGPCFPGARGNSLGRGTLKSHLTRISISPQRN